MSGLGVDGLVVLDKMMYMMYMNTTATQQQIRDLTSAVCRLSLLLEGVVPPLHGKQTQQATGNRGIPISPTPRVVVRKNIRYIIPSNSPYFSNPAPLLEQYKPPRSKTLKKQTPIIQPLPPSSPNPFDGMEVEVVEFAPYIIVPSKYKETPKPPQPPKRTRPDPESTRTVPIQAVAPTKSREVQTSESFQWNWSGQGTVSRVTQTDPLESVTLANERFSSIRPQTQPITTSTIKPTTRQDIKRKTHTTSGSDATPHKQPRKGLFYVDSDDEYQQPQPSQTAQELLHNTYNSTDSGSDFVSQGSEEDSD